MADEKILTLKHWWDAADVFDDPPVLYKILEGRRVSSAQLNFLGQAPYSDLQAIHEWEYKYGATRVLTPHNGLLPVELYEPETVLIGSKPAFRFPYTEQKIILFEERLIRPKPTLVIKWSSGSTDIYNFQVAWRAEVSIYGAAEVPFATSTLYSAIGSDSSTANATNVTEIYLGDLTADMGKTMAVKFWREIQSTDDTLNDNADLQAIEVR